MNVVDFLKEKKDKLAKGEFDIHLPELKIPSFRDYWTDFLHTSIPPQLAEFFGNQPEPTQEYPILEIPEVAELYERLVSDLGNINALGDWHQVDQSGIDLFAESTLDKQWIHTDPEKASKDSPYKCTIAHGFLTLSLIPHLTRMVDTENPPYPEANMCVNYGLNKVRFPYPVRVGSKVRARTRNLSVEPFKRGLELVTEVTIELENSRRPACVAEMVLRLYF